MLLLPLMLLLFAHSVVNQEHAENENLPSMWDQAPSQLEDYKIQDSKVIINMWNYKERLGLGKILMSTTEKYFVEFGPNNTGNLLWSLAVFTGWEWKTGRLTCSYEHEDSLHICSDSWWASINYFILGTSFLAAANAGILGNLAYSVEFLPPEKNSVDFCYNFSHCSSVTPKVMETWTAFFEHIKSNPICNATVSPFFSPDVDKAWKLFWVAHLAWHEPNEKLNYKLQGVSRAEAQFARDFLKVVDFIGATHYPANLDISNTFVANFPDRALKGISILTDILFGGFTQQQTTLMFLFNTLNNLDNIAGGLLLHQWQKAMSTEEGRAEGRKIVTIMVEIPMVFMFEKGLNSTNGA